MPRGQKRRPALESGRRRENDAFQQQDTADRTAAAREFLHSVESFIRECYEDGPPHKAALNMAKSSIMNLLTARQGTTAAKARAACLIKLPNGKEPRTGMALAPGSLDITPSMLMRCISPKLNGPQFVMKLSHELCRLTGLQGHKSVKSRMEHWDALMGLTWASPPVSTPHPSPPATDEPFSSPLENIEHDLKERIKARPMPGPEPVPKEELKAFFAAYGNCMSSEVVKKVIALFGSFRQAIPLIEHVLLRRRRAAMDLDFMCPNMKHPVGVESRLEAEPRSGQEMMNDISSPSGPAPSLWEELVLRAANTFGVDDGSCESEENIEKLQEIFGPELPRGLAVQAVQHCSDVDAAIRWIQPMFDGHFYGKEILCSDPEDTDVEMSDDPNVEASNKAMIEPNIEDSLMADAGGERRVRLRLRNDRTAHVRLRTAAGLETLMAGCQSISVEEWEAQRPKLIACMGSLIDDLRLLPGQHRGSGTSEAKKKDPRDSSSDSDSDSDESEDAEVVKPSPVRNLPGLKPIDLSEVMPFTSALPHDTWEQYKSVMINLYSSGGFFLLSPKKRLHKIIKVIYQPEESVCFRDKAWTRLRAVVRIVEKLVVATGDRNRDENPHMEVVKCWVGNKMRDVAMLAKLDEEDCE